MSKRIAGALAAVLSLSTAAFAQTADAQDGDDPKFIVRDREGDLKVTDDAAGFGQKGQWTFSTDAALSIERRTQSGFEAVTSVSIFPAADYFIIENLSVGGVLGIGYSKAGDNSSTTFRIGPRVGYNFEVSPMLSVWPKIGFSYSHTNISVGRGSVAGTPGDVTVSADNNAIQLNLFAPVMLHPAEHFFAGFGPFLDVDLSGENRATAWGFRLTLGGWI